jgi:predicted nucleotidyltransferase
MKWIPLWLGEIYSKLYLNFAGNRDFSVQQAAEKLKISRDLFRVALSKLVEAGWLSRVGRGTYMLKDPRGVVMAMRAEDVFDLKLVPAPFTTSVKEFCIRVLSVFGSRLRSAVLFGSIARGDWNEGSDIDLLLVIKGLPKNVLERDTEILPLTRGLPHSITLVSYTPEELTETPPLLLDVAIDGILLYDTGFMREKIGRVRKKLEELGAKRVGEKNGLTWILKPRVELGEEVEI